MNLETKRNAIMNAIASGQLTNLLADTTWVSGFLNANGGIDSTGTRAVVSDYIEISGEYFLSISHTSNSISNYMLICYYDENKSFIAPRDYLANSTAGTEIVRVSHNINNAKYLRVCYARQNATQITAGLYDITTPLEEEVDITNVV